MDDADWRVNSALSEARVNVLGVYIPRSQAQIPNCCGSGRGGWGAKAPAFVVQEMRVGAVGVAMRWHCVLSYRSVRELLETTVKKLEVATLGTSIQHGH
jgi:hypothetical protein